MQIVCTAVVDDDKDREELLEHAIKLGATSSVDGRTVFAEYEGEDGAIENFINLFSHYRFYGISYMA